jgi:hypothetical protein
MSDVKFLMDSLAKLESAKCMQEDCLHLRRMLREKDKEKDKIVDSYVEKFSSLKILLDEVRKQLSNRGYEKFLPLVGEYIDAKTIVEIVNAEISIVSELESAKMEKT